MPSPHNLGHVGALVDGETEKRGHESGDHLVGLPADEFGAVERDSDADHREQQGQVEPEDELDQQRGAPEEPGVGTGGETQDRTVGQLHHRDDDPDGDAEDHRDEGELNGHPEAFEDHAVELVLGDDVPVKIGVDDDGVGEPHGEQRGGENREPAPGARPFGHLEGEFVLLRRPVGGDDFRPPPGAIPGIFWWLISVLTARR